MLQFTTLDAAAPSNLDQDFGYQPFGSIGDTVWIDVNGDGVQNPTESGIADVMMVLTMPDGSVMTTTTDTLGQYIFPNLPYGTYEVTVVTSTLPENVAPTYDADGGLDNTSTVTLDATTPDNVDQDFGYEPTGSIGNTVWVDADGDNEIDPDETRIPDVIVELEMEDGTVITTTTGPTGEYLFENLPFGAYTITLDTSTLPAGLIQTYAPNGVLDHSVQTSIDAENPDSTDQDLGYMPPTGSIGNTVWLDLDNDGTVNDGEVGLPDVVVLLETPDGTLLTTTTDTDGMYIFPNLPAGTYTVTIDTNTLPDELIIPVFDDDGLETPHQSVVTIEEGDDNLEQDFGYAPSTTAVTLRNIGQGDTRSDSQLVLVMTLVLIVTLLAWAFKRKV